MMMDAAVVDVDDDTFGWMNEDVDVDDSELDCHSKNMSYYLLYLCYHHLL